MKHILLTVSLLFCIADVCAQNVRYLYMLDSVLDGSLTDRSMKAGFTEDSIGHRRGLNPADPRFEIAYFFENRFEANLTVDLDMPSLYHQRNMLSKLNIDRSKADYRQDRMASLSELSDCYLELIYNLRLGAIFQKMFPMDSIEPYRKYLQQAFDNGDISALKYADLQMTITTFSDAVMETARQTDLLTDRIRIYSPEFVPMTTDFPIFGFEGMGQEEFVKEAMSRNPLSDMIEADSLIYSRQLKLARWEWAPKIVVGARLDMDEKRNFAPAAIAGLSIPLWENRGNIRHAKAKMTHGAIENERRETEFKNQLEQLYKRYTTAEAMISNWKEYDIEYHSKKLRLAYNTGLISASELYFEFSHVMENATRITQLQLERALCAARMTILLNENEL